MKPATAVLFVAVPPRLKFTSEEKRTLKSFATTLAVRVGGGRGFTCAITNDEALRSLNKTFRDRDYATDVLSFPASNNGAGDWGDIAISAERAAEQAEEFGHSRLDEVRLLMLHGVLHLTGMDHERDGGEMARTETALRTEFGLEKGLIERSKEGKKAR